MKGLSSNLSNLTALISLLTAIFGIIFGITGEPEHSANRGDKQPSVSEHRLGMHKANAPVQIKKATTTEEQAATRFSSTETKTVPISTEQASEQATEASVPGFVYSETGDLLAGVNTLRAAYGLSPLSGDSILEAAAATRAAELTVCMSHTRPDGRPASSIITDYGIACSYRGENIAAGYALPGSVLTGWEESPSHLENLLNPVFTRAGISHTVTDTGYLDYWVILLSD